MSAATTPRAERGVEHGLFATAPDEVGSPGVAQALSEENPQHALKCDGRISYD
jgi:hypothetical protein